MQPRSGIGTDSNHTLRLQVAVDARLLIKLGTSEVVFGYRHKPLELENISGTYSVLSAQRRRLTEKICVEY
jgi:hypothetical protein